MLNNNIRNTLDDAIPTTVSSNLAYPLTNNKIGGNTIQNSGGKGIDIRGTSSQVFNNRIDKIWTNGIATYGQHILIIGNKVSECGMAGTTIDAIFLVGTGHLVCGNDVKKCAVSQSSTAQAGGASTIQLSANASGGSGDYVGRKITILSGTGSGQTKTITAYVGDSPALPADRYIATVDSPWATPPNNTSVYEIIPAGNSQRWGILNASEKSTVYGNDTNLGWTTAPFGLNEAGVGTLSTHIGAAAGTSLALTGALTGTTIAGTTLALNGAGEFISRTGSATGFVYMGVSTSGQLMQLGVDRNTGGGLATGSGAYSVVLNANSSALHSILHAGPSGSRLMVRVPPG